MKTAKDVLIRLSYQAGDFNLAKGKAILDKCKSSNAFSICGNKVIPSQVCKTVTLLYGVL